MAASGTSEDPHKASERVARQLERDAKRLRCAWWETDTADVIGDLIQAGAVTVVLAAITRAINRTRDVLWVVGAESPAAAQAVAWEWIGAGVEPTDVASWLQAGCWDPAAARDLTLAGIGIVGLLAPDGTPRHWFDTPAGERVPLAQAVADKHITATEASDLIDNGP
jgi:hypothetical protein